MNTIQELTVINPTSLTPTVRLRISDSAEIDDSGVWITASVTIDREWVSFETIELTALDKVLELVADAKAAVKAASDEIQKLHN